MYIANYRQSKRGKMLLSENKKERLAEATIELAEIKVTKKLIVEAEKKLSDKNKEISDKMLKQLNTASEVYSQNLKPILQKTASRSLVKFVDSIIENSKKCADRLTDELTDEEFAGDLPGITAWHNIGIALGYFLKRFPNAIGGIKTFKEKAGEEGANSQLMLIEIFDDSEQAEIKKRLKEAAGDPIRIFAVLTNDDFYDKKRELGDSIGKFDSISATLPQFVQLIRDAYDDMNNIDNDSPLSLSDPVEFNIDTISNEILESTLSSINPMLGPKKLEGTEGSNDEELSPIEKINNFLAAPEEENSIWKDDSLYKKALDKLSEEIEFEIGISLDAADTKKFIISIKKLIPDTITEKELSEIMSEIQDEIKPNK